MDDFRNLRLLGPVLGHSPVPCLVWPSVVGAACTIDPMRLIKFDKYKDYVKAQTVTNKRKLECVWATYADMRTIADYVTKYIPDPSFGICHGVRNGWEVHKLRSLLPGVDVIGTEISDSATRFKHVIQWDFHEIKEQWVSQVDFIYSNSLDHSYDPELCLDQWMKCIKPTGRCFIEWSAAANEEGTSEADCFRATAAEYQQLLSQKYDIETIIKVKGSALKRKIKAWKLTRVVSLGLPKQFFIVKHRNA